MRKNFLIWTFFIFFLIHTNVWKQIVWKKFTRDNRCKQTFSQTVRSLRRESHAVEIYSTNSHHIYMAVAKKKAAKKVAKKAVKKAPAKKKVAKKAVKKVAKKAAPKKAAKKVAKKK